MIEGSGSRAGSGSGSIPLTIGSGSGSIPLTIGSGSGSRRPKNMWIRWIRIRIRVRNTALNCSRCMKALNWRRADSSSSSSSLRLTSAGGSGDNFTLAAGLEKTPGLKKKKPAQWVFFGFYLAFWGLFYFILFICPEERVFRVFFSFKNTFRSI